MLNAILPAPNKSDATRIMRLELGPVGQSAKALGKALRTDDLDAARTAYVQLAKALPRDQQTSAGAPFVEMGKALARGDMEAAQTAFRSMLRGAAGSRNDIPSPQPVALPMETTGGTPKPSSTGGQAGGLLNAVA